MSGMTAIESALNDRLKLLPSFDAANCDWENVPYKIVPGTPYLQPRIVGINRRGLSIGNKPILQWDGTYQVSAFYPSAKGKTPVNQRVDQILDLFFQGLTLTATGLLDPGVRIVAASPQPSPPTAGDWIQGIVRIPFFAHELQT